ncbi:MAG: hypothetical protein EB117_15435 [Betaproteobacteria bacterium]|nr:hypothetical protein [Betaproteobacteria bacterium]
MINLTKKGEKVAQKPLTEKEMQEAIDIYARYGLNMNRAASAMNLPRSTFENRLRRAKKLGLKSSVEPNSDLEEVLEQERLDQLLREQVRSLQLQLETVRKETLDQEFVKSQIIKLAQTKIDPPKWTLSRPADETTGVPTLFASDWHWGEVVEASQVNGVNEYNLKIAQNRAKNMIETAVDLLLNHIHHKDYPGIVFCLGGDMVSGDIHEELMATNEKEIMPVIVDLWSTLAWCIETLADSFGAVYVPCVSGNHGRNTHKPRAKGRNFTNFDWLVYQFLAKRFESDDRIRFNIPDGSDCYFQIYNHKYLLTHGDQFRGGDGMIGALGPIIRGDHKKRSRNNQIEMGYDTLLLGHWHQLIQLQRLIVNGSLKGYDEYAYAGNFPFEAPRQALWITHPNKGITFSAPVQVERFGKVKSLPWVSWK